MVLLAANSNNSNFTVQYSQLRELTPQFPWGLGSNTTAGNSENPRIIHCPPKKSALVFFLRFSLFSHEYCNGELLLFFLHLLEHYAEWLEDPFELSNNFNAPICEGGVGGGSWDSSVGIETRCGLEGPVIECRWRRDFPQRSIPSLGPTLPPIQWVPGLSRG